MAEFEELKLVVNLTDNASAGLITLRNQLANVQQAATASVPAFQNIARHTSNFGTQVKGLAAELQKLTSSIPFLGVQLGGLTPHFETLIAKMPMFTRGALLAGSGVAALAVGVYRLGNSLGEFSKGQIALAALARTLGSTSGQIKVMVDQMRGVFSPEEAKQQIAIFGEWVQDISRAGSESAAKFRQTYGDAGDEMMRHVIEMYDSGKIEEAWNYYVTTMRKSLATTTAQVGAQAAGGYLEEAMSKELGGPGTSSRVLDLPDIKPATEEQKKEAEQRLAQARSMLAAWNDLEVAIERLGQQVEASLLPYMTEVAQLINTYGPSWSDGIGKSIDATAKDIEDISRIINQLVTLMTPISRKDAPSVLQQRSPMNAFERFLRRPFSQSGAGTGGGAAGTAFLTGGAGADTLGGYGGGDVMGMGASGGQWYAHMRRSENVEDDRAIKLQQNTDQLRQLNDRLSELSGGGGAGGGGSGGIGGGGGDGGRGPTFRPGIGPGSSYAPAPSGPTFTSPTSPEGAPGEVSKAMLGTGEAGKYTLGDVQAAVTGQQASATGYAGVGQYNFMGSRLAASMGMNVTPGTTQDMVTRKTAAGVITANKYAADDIGGFIDDLKAAGAPLNNFSGVYSPRQKRGGGGWSQHAYGNALDIETGFGSGPDNSPYLYKWAQEHPQEFADIQAKHHMRNLYSPGGTHDWGHFEWTPTGRAPPPSPTDAATAERLKSAAKGFSPTGPGTPLTGVTAATPGVATGSGQTGTMSYYNEVGKLTSTGEPFDPRAFAGAIPMRGRSEYGGVTGKSGPAWVDVIDTKTGKMARIRINDVGGLPQGSAPTPRVFDATPAVRDYFGGSDLHPDMQIIRLPPGKYTAGPITREQHDAAIGADRKTVDQGMGNEAAKAEATGTINVNVTAPRRTRIGARGTGLFKKVNVDRQTQMAPAAEGPSAATGGL